METTEPIKYARTVTFMRGNIPHSGHVELVQMMLAYGERAIVYISTGKQNNDWDTRALLLKHLLRESKVDLKRVELVKSSNPFHAVSQTVMYAPWGEAAIVLGSDQQDMARKLGEEFDCPWIINRRTNSSTQMRFFLDVEDFIEDLRHLYNGSEFAITLAKVLRMEEINRDKLIASGKVA